MVFIFNLKCTAFSVIIINYFCESNIFLNQSVVQIIKNEKKHRRWTTLEVKLFFKHYFMTYFDENVNIRVGISQSSTNLYCSKNTKNTKLTKPVVIKLCLKKFLSATHIWWKYFSFNAFYTKFNSRKKFFPSKVYVIARKVSPLGDSGLRFF